MLSYLSSGFPENAIERTRLLSMVIGYGFFPLIPRVRRVASESGAP